MTSDLQTLFAFVIVAAAALWLARRTFKKKAPGCGGDCGCPSSEIKAKLRR